MSHSSSPSPAYYSATSASPTGLVYSPEMLLQFQSNNSSTTSILSQLQLHPEITDDGTIQFRNHGMADSEDSDYMEDDEDDESHYIYGDMPSRKDLNWKQLFDLRKVVRAIVQDTLTFTPTEEEYQEESYAPSFTTTTAFDSFRSRRSATGRFTRSSGSSLVSNEYQSTESNRNFAAHHPRKSDQYQSQSRRQNKNDNSSWWPRKAPTSAPWRNLERHPILVPTLA